MADLIEALHNLVRERARGGPSPLLALRRLDARPGARISHLGISQRLAQAWVTVTGEPFRPHQSLALSALRRGEPLALVGGGAARQSFHLLALELLRAEAPAAALLLAPDEPSAMAHRAELERLVRALGEPLRVGVALGAEARSALSAQIVVATPHALHERILRHHDRAWAALWPRLRLLLLAEAHAYGGLAGAHVGWLILRAARLAPAERPPQLVASIAPVAGVAEALEQIAGEPWRVFPAEDGPVGSAAVALWRPGGERLREAAALALGLVRGGGGVHLTCEPVEAQQIRALVGSDVAGVSVGPSPLPAAAQIIVGSAAASAYLRQCLDGAQLTTLLLGDDPADRTVARLAARDPGQIPLLDDPPPTWVVAPGNAYVTAQHLICAAAERPLSAQEVAAWGAESVVARLEEHRRLVRLPDAAWQPLPDGGNVYAGFDLRSAGTPPGLVRDEQGEAQATLDVAAFDRWGFAGAALPPLRGGFRVVARDEGELELTVRPAEARRTLPLRRCTVRVRDCRERRTVRGREVGWGRVVLDEEVYGFREAAGANAPAERALNPPLASSLAAPACWIDLPAGVSDGAQLAGWCVVAALPLRSLSSLVDLVPAYDAEARRVYFVDAQPGGNGASAWLFSTLEELLPCAYDVALDCRGDPLLEPLARADMDWLLALLAAEGSTPAPRPEALALPVSPPPVRLEPRSAPRQAEPPPLPRRAEPPAETPPPRRPEPVRPEPAPPRQPEPPPPARRVEPAPPRQPEPPPPARRAEQPASSEPPFPQRPEPAAPRGAEPPRAEPPPRPVEPPAPTPEPRPAPAETLEPDARLEELEPPEPPRREPSRPPRAEPPRRGITPERPGKTVRPEQGPQRGERDRRPPPGARDAAAQPPLPLDPEPVAEPPRPVAAPEPLPDAAAMVARLRRIREQRERTETPRGPRPPAADNGAEPRFHPGERIVCTPYGKGEVIASRVEEGHELLVVDFPSHGELTIDAAVNAARLDDDDAPPADDDF
jgi:hypothetical protein